MITTNATNTTSLGIQIRAEDGNVREVCRVSGSIRAGRMVSVVVDMHDQEAVTENLTAITQQVMAFISDTLTRAAGEGLPVAGCEVSADGSC